LGRCRRGYPQSDWRYDAGVSVGVAVGVSRVGVVDVSVAVGVSDGVGVIGVEAAPASPTGMDNT